MIDFVCQVLNCFSSTHNTRLFGVEQLLVANKAPVKKENKKKAFSLHYFQRITTDKFLVIWWQMCFISYILTIKVVGTDTVLLTEVCAPEFRCVKCMYEEETFLCLTMF